MVPRLFQLLTIDLLYSAIVECENPLPDLITILKLPYCTFQWISVSNLGIFQVHQISSCFPLLPPTQLLWKAHLYTHSFWGFMEISCHLILIRYCHWVLGFVLKMSCRENSERLKTVTTNIPESSLFTSYLYVLWSCQFPAVMRFLFVRFYRTIGKQKFEGKPRIAIEQILLAPAQLTISHILW